MAGMQRLDVDGVPVFWSERDEPAVGALAFRAGQADETLPRRGITHAVEHLALFPLGRTDFAYNGFVDDLVTVFHANGTTDEVGGYLEAVCSNLSALPLDRLETELGVLLTEDSSMQANFHGRLLSHRYGRRGFGLGNSVQLGLPGLTRAEVAEWASARFTAGNAAGFFAGPDPPALRLALPEGDRRPPPALEELPGLQLPLVVFEGTGGVAASFVVERTTAITAALGVAAERLQERLRRREGLSYSVSLGYTPLGPDRAHAVLGADCRDPMASQVATALMDVVEDLAGSGPPAEELEREIERSVRAQTEDPDRDLGLLDRAMIETLLGGDERDGDTLLAELRATTAGDVRAALSTALSSLILVVPPGTRSPRETLHRLPEPSTTTLPGRTFPDRPRRFARAKGAVIVGDEGISITPPGEAPVSVRWNDLAAAVRDPAGPIAFLAIDGTWIEVDPSRFRRGDELSAEIERHLTPELVAVRGDDSPGGIATAAVAKLPGRVDALAGELENVAARLRPRERIVSLAEVWSRFGPGVLALTTERLLFAAGNAKTEDEEIERASLTSAEPGDRPGAPSLRVRGDAAELVYSGFIAQPRCDEFLAELRDGLERGADGGQPAGTAASASSSGT